MGGLVDVHQSCGIDRSIGLGGGERGVTEQFLDGAQVTAGVQKVGREAVPHGMRRGRSGQAQLSAGLFHDHLDVTCIELATAYAAEKGCVRGCLVGGRGKVGVNRFARGRENGDDASF